MFIFAWELIIFHIKHSFISHHMARQSLSKNQMSLLVVGWEAYYMFLSPFSFFLFWKICWPFFFFFAVFLNMTRYLQQHCDLTFKWQSWSTWPSFSQRLRFLSPDYTLFFSNFQSLSCNSFLFFEILFQLNDFSLYWSLVDLCKIIKVSMETHSFSKWIGWVGTESYHYLLF